MRSRFDTFSHQKLLDWWLLVGSQGRPSKRLSKRVMSFSMEEDTTTVPRCNLQCRMQNWLVEHEFEIDETPKSEMNMDSFVPSVVCCGFVSRMLDSGYFSMTARDSILWTLSKPKHCISPPSWQAWHRPEAHMVSMLLRVGGLVASMLLVGIPILYWWPLWGWGSKEVKEWEA